MKTDTLEEPKCLVATCPSCGLIHAISRVGTEDWIAARSADGLEISERPNTEVVALPEGRFCRPGGCGCKSVTVICPDPIIAENIKEMAGRSVVGIGKYQKMLTRTDLSPEEWFTHHRTELMDAMGYNRKLEGIYDEMQATIKRQAERIAELERTLSYAEPLARIAELEAENARALGIKH